MKYFLFCIVFILSSCFGGDSDSSSSSAGTTLRTIEQNIFTMSVPASWQEVSGSLPAPKQGEVALSLRSNTLRDGYYNNLIIIESDNTTDTNSSDLLSSSESILQADLQSYSLIDADSLEFADGDTGRSLIFSGRYNRNTPIITYIQTAKICDETSYFLTISVKEQLESYERYRDILSTFECR